MKKYKNTGSSIRIDREQAVMWRAVEELGDYVEELESNEPKEAAATLDRLKRLIEGYEVIIST